MLVKYIYLSKTLSKWYSIGMKSNELFVLWLLLGVKEIILLMGIKFVLQYSM